MSFSEQIIWRSKFERYKVIAVCRVFIRAGSGEVMSEIVWDEEEVVASMAGGCATSVLAFFGVVATWLLYCWPMIFLSTDTR